jgi:hypothetical protein
MRRCAGGRSRVATKAGGERASPVLKDRVQPLCCHKGDHGTESIVNSSRGCDTPRNAYRPTETSRCFISPTSANAADTHCGDVPFGRPAHSTVSGLRRIQSAQLHTTQEAEKTRRPCRGRVGGAAAKRPFPASYRRGYAARPRLPEHPKIRRLLHQAPRSWCGRTRASGIRLDSPSETSALRGLDGACR